MPQTLEQQRAAFAWEWVNKLSPHDREGYSNLAKAMPMMVMNSGLMQALAFLNEKGKPHHIALLNHLTHWITEQGRGEQVMPFAVLMPQLFNANPVQFRYYTAEALAVLRWIRQLAATE